MIAVIGRALSFTAMTLTVTSFFGCNDEPKSGNGVNDVRASCEIRAKWNRTPEKCGLCEAAVVAPRCECTELAEFSAACIEQADARTPVCPETIDTCVASCNRNDCNCIDGCYAANAACKNASAARDGCVADACSSYCR